MKTTQKFKCIKQVCKNLGYKIMNLDPVSSWLFEIENHEQKRIILPALGSPLNTSSSIKIADDKKLSYILLKRAGIRIPKGEAFFLNEEYKAYRKPGYEEKDMYFYAKKLGYPLFIKPNDKSQGKLAQKIFDERELKDDLHNMKKHTNIVLMQEYIDLPEYRLFILDGRIECIYERAGFFIQGDGNTTLTDLIFKKYPTQANTIIKSLFFKKECDLKKIKLYSILPQNMLLRLSSTNNIHDGGEVLFFSDHVKDICQKWAQELKKIIGLRIMGVDIFTSHENIYNPEKWIVSEINANPGITGITPKTNLKIWEKIIKKCFEGA